MKPLSAFFLSVSFAAGLVLSSCAAFSKDDLNQSALKKHYDPPVIKISPNPLDPITAVSADISISVEHPGGLGSISFQSDGGLKTYNASSATVYNIKDTINSVTSRAFPMKVTAYSAKTGISSTTNVEFLLFAGSVSDPPLITVAGPVEGSLLAPGAVTIRGSAHQPAAKIESLSIERAGFAPVDHPVPIPNPAKYDFAQVENVVAGDTLDITITAVSATGIVGTTNMTWQVVDIPDIVSIDPPTTGTDITTTQTNFSVVVRSPHSVTTVRLYWGGVLKSTLTTDGSGTPLVFNNISIPLRAAASPTGNTTLRIEATYPSGRTARTDYIYSVDHSLALIPPAITFLSPDPAIPLRANSFIFRSEIEQASVGIKSVTFARTSPPVSSRTTNISATPMLPLYSQIENIPLGSYVGTHSYRLTSVSHANVTNISNFTYTVEGPTNTIALSYNDTASQAFDFRVTSDTNISYVLISTNTGGASGWRNIAAYVPNFSSYIVRHSIPVPFNSVMGVRLLSFDTNGIISTNIMANTFVTHSSAFISTVFPPRDSDVPQTGGFPFTATVLSPTPITDVELKVNRNTVFFLAGITSGSTSYTFNTDISTHLVLGDNEIHVIVNGAPAVGSPVDYKSTMLGGRGIFASYIQDKTVVTTSTARINIKNWEGSVQLPGGQSTITKLSTGEVQQIITTINSGTSYIQPVAQAFDLDIGENKFKIRLENGGLVKENEIMIYRHNNTNY